MRPTCGSGVHWEGLFHRCEHFDDVSPTDRVECDWYEDTPDA